MKKKTLKIKMALDTVLSGGREVKRRSWRFKKKIPLNSPMTKKLGRRLKKLTKFMGLFALSAAMILLSGCGRRGGYTEPEEIEVVSAIGVDSTEDGVEVSLQSVEEGGGTRVRRARGASISAALARLNGSSTKRLELSHCALAVLGDRLDGETVSQLYELCRQRGEISGAILFVSANNAAALLSAQDAVGYDIASAMSPHPDGAGLFSKSRLYEIVDSEGRARVATALPYLRVTDGGYSAAGLKLYRDRREIVLLDRLEGAVYLMLRGIFTSGTVEYTHMGTAAIAKCSTDLGGIDSGRVGCRLTLAENMDEGGRELLGRWLEAAAAELYSRLTAEHGDLFGFGSGDTPLDFEFLIEEAA